MSPTNFNALAIRGVLGRADWSPPQPHGPDGWSWTARTADSRVIASCDLCGDGEEWIHASISHRDRMPTHDDLKLLHRAVFGDGWAYQVFAPLTEHINIHPFALHLFGRLDGKPALPDFTYGMGSI